MEVCQRLTGSGGRPLTIVMSPDAQFLFYDLYPLVRSLALETFARLYLVDG